MQRREALRLLMAGGVLPALPTNLFAFFQGAHPASGYTLRTLNPHQNDTVVAMIDQIIPATDTPGAKGARVNEFIDVILTEWPTPKNARIFSTVSPEWTNKLMTSSERISWTLRPPSKSHCSVPWTNPSPHNALAGCAMATPSRKSAINSCAANFSTSLKASPFTDTTLPKSASHKN